METKNNQMKPKILSKIKPLIAFAIVKKKNPKLLIGEIYYFRDMARRFKRLDEKIIKVKIEII